MIRKNSQAKKGALKKPRKTEKYPISLKEELIRKNETINHLQFLLKKAEAEVGIKTGYGVEGATLTLIELEAANRELKRLNEELVKTRTELDKKVKEKTKELQARVDELEKFRKLTVGRELKMVEIKEEIEKLKGELKNQRPVINNK